MHVSGILYEIYFLVLPRRWIGSLAWHIYALEGIRPEGFIKNLAVQLGYKITLEIYYVHTAVKMVSYIYPSWPLRDMHTWCTSWFNLYFVRECLPLTKPIIETSCYVVQIGLSRKQPRPSWITLCWAGHVDLSTVRSLMLTRMESHQIGMTLMRAVRLCLISLWKQKTRFESCYLCILQCVWRSPLHSYLHCEWLRHGHKECKKPYIYCKARVFMSANQYNSYCKYFALMFAPSGVLLDYVCQVSLKEV